ncbi:hypothetical protein [Janthinobacterium sp.]|uniref:hypothetical protein n=1 Tax=Janthinobacterium sp. TaxID=1871054 RepID=UPI00293D82BA|nr:hypothetical protein [Janthinobacterium sp.]
MARIAPTRETLIALFAKSGNVCAFPGCTHELVTSRNIFVSQVCHIEAANRGGQRFNPNSTDEQRRSFENLLLLCYRHHKETDDVTTYDANALYAIKNRHESIRGEKPFKINEAFLHRLEEEMQAYWNEIEVANDEKHVSPDFAVKINVGIPATRQFAEIGAVIDRILEILSHFAESDTTLNEEIRRHLKSLGYDVAAFDSVPYFKNPFFNRNWEMHALAVNNTHTNLVVALKQTEVRFLDEYVKTHPSDGESLAALETAKQKLHDMAISTGYAD